MASTLLHVFFSGMIAFVNNRPDPDMMSAYVIKHIEHEAELMVEITDTSTVGTIAGADCAKKPINGKAFLVCNNITGPIDIVLNPASAKSAHTMYARPQNVRPFNRTDATNISWLVHMSTVDEDGGKAKKFEDVSSLVSLQMGFSWKNAETCHLDQVEVGSCQGEDCAFQVDPVHFVKSISSTLGHVQAVAETVMFELEMPNDSVSLYLKERNGSHSFKVDLKCMNGTCPDLWVTNNPTKRPSDDMEDVGHHFVGYYALAAGNPQQRFPVRMRENAVPYSLGGRKQKFFCPTVTEESGLDVRKGAQTRIICPMVVFEN
ncbi:MAG TPA: hypothetical protein VGG20_00725 [Thermoanaerobaculia bacterium]